MAEISTLFDTICNALKDQQEHTLRVISGPACERWLTSEARVAIGWSTPTPLSNQEFMLAEQKPVLSRIADLMIYNCLDTNTLRDVDTVIEAKLVYPCTDNAINTKLQELRNQLDDHESDRVAQNSDTRIHGLVYAIWTNGKAYKNDGIVELPVEFYDRVTHLLQEMFPIPEYSSVYQHQFHEVITRSSLDWPGGWITWAAMGATTVSRNLAN